MRYLGGIFWSFLISSLLGYVLPSMTGAAFSFGPVIVLTVVFSVIITIVGDGIITPDTKKTVE